MLPPCSAEKCIGATALPSVLDMLMATVQLHDPEPKFMCSASYGSGVLELVPRLSGRPMSQLFLSPIFSPGSGECMS